LLERWQVIPLLGSYRINPESTAKKVIEEYLGVKLEKKRLNVFEKYKEFDLVNFLR